MIEIQLSFATVCANCIVIEVKNETEKFFICYTPATGGRGAMLHNSMKADGGDDENHRLIKSCFKSGYAREKIRSIISKY